MDLKSQMDNDISTVFLNSLEFGEEIMFENEKVTVVIDDDQMKKRQLRKGLSEFHTEELIFYVQRNAISFYPRPDNVLLFENIRWRVMNVQEDVGLFTILAERVSG